MRVEDLVAWFPRLFHMAEAGSWPSIRKHGLLSTSALLDLYGMDGAERQAIEGEHRPNGVTLVTPALPPAVVRDQKPLNIRRLDSCLIDMSVDEWLRHLNRRVFFWTSENRLERLLGATPYRDQAHDVLVVDTALLVDRHRELITLAPYNTGATMPTAVPRGTETFKTIEEYQYDDWCGRPRWDRVVELAVDRGVEDIRDFVIRVESRRGTKILSELSVRSDS